MCQKLFYYYPIYGFSILNDRCFEYFRLILLVQELNPENQENDF